MLHMPPPAQHACSSAKPSSPQAPPRPCACAWLRACCGTRGIQLLLGALWLQLLQPPQQPSAWGAAAAAAGPPGSWPSSGPELLKDCINEGYEFKQTSWNESTMHDSPANVYLERVWWSTRPRAFNFTVFTQLSFDRTPALFNICSVYTGPLSAAVYLPLVQGPPGGSWAVPGGAGAGAAPPVLSRSNVERVRHEVARLDRLHKQLEASMQPVCQLDLMFFHEAFDDADASMLYPVNTLRNFARMQVCAACNQAAFMTVSVTVMPPAVQQF